MNALEQDGYSLEDFDPKCDSCSAESQIMSAEQWQKNRKSSIALDR